jgi:uncharacterized membrane protein
MTVYKEESHLRSILKGVTWRILATSDTILVVLAITCFYGECTLKNAIEIGLIEFVLKLVIYYIHERLWQKVFKDGIITTRTTLYKTIVWRIIATTITFIISGSVLKAFDEIALFIALVELFTKFMLYYLHERIWLKLPIGRIRHYVFGKKQ